MTWDLGKGEQVGMAAVTQVAASASCLLKALGPSIDCEEDPVGMGQRETDRSCLSPSPVKLCCWLTPACPSP